MAVALSLLASLRDSIKALDLPVELSSIPRRKSIVVTDQAALDARFHWDIYPKVDYDVENVEDKQYSVVYNLEVLGEFSYTELIDHIKSEVLDDEFIR